MDTMSKPEFEYLDSKILSDLRRFIELNPSLEKVTGSLVQFKIVIDANFVVGDLLRKLNFPNIKNTAIEEVVKADVVKLYAPTWLDQEMTSSTIPQVSKKKNIPENILFEMWVEYKECIIWDDNYDPNILENAEGDTKDIPYVALQKCIDADGILSRDKDIDDLGGNRVGLELILNTRSYARAATYSVAIRAGGIFIGSIGFNLLESSLKGIVSLISKIPPSWRLVLLGAVIVILTQPEVREKLVRFAKGLGEIFVEFWPEIEKLIALAEEKQREADQALIQAKEAI